MLKGKIFVFLFALSAIRSLDEQAKESHDKETNSTEKPEKKQVSDNNTNCLIEILSNSEVKQEDATSDENHKRLERMLIDYLNTNARLLDLDNNVESDP